MMGNCLLCEEYLEQKSSWRTLLGYKPKDIICKTCLNSFKKADILTETPYLDSVYSLYQYNEAMKRFIYQYKFLQDLALAPVFAEDLQKTLKEKHNIIPIPMHEARERERTFAHVEQLLICAKIDYEQLLVKQDESRMGEKSRAERLTMQPLFKLDPSAHVEHVTYTLVDDIYTTGATLQQAAKVLLEAGAASVEAITLIRA